MKPIILYSFLFLTGYKAMSQKQTFDIISYSVPKGWKTDKKEGTFSLAKDGGTKGFCFITLYKSIDAGNDSKQNFDLSWESLVQNTLSTGNPVMQPVSNDDEWVTQVGSAAFNNNDILGTAILLSSTKKSKLVNIVVLINGTELIPEMQTFLESITMTLPEKQVTSNSTSDEPVKLPVTTPDIKTPKHEVWMNYGYSMAKGRYTVRYLLKYANGDCLGYIPEEGVLGFSKVTDNKTDRHWGVAKDKGTQTHIEYNDGSVLKLGNESATKNSYPPGSTSSYYFKCMSVDGLKLDGEWSSGGSYGNPNWYKDANFKDGTIKFYKDGRFENNKGYVSMKEGRNGYLTRDQGNGTYYIKDFTLVMTYNDGQVFKASITGLKSVNPQQDNAILFLREVPFFKRLK